MKFIKIILFFFLSSSLLYSFDVIKINKAHSSNDIRYKYPLELLTLSLNKSKDKYGDYKIEFSPILLKRDRALKELTIGQLINVHSTPTRKEWEEEITPIYFPIRKGILGYREFLINKKDIQKFKSIESLEELKALNAGLGLQWSTTKVMKEQGFNVVTGESYEGLFKMLSKNRFDYFPRGINEIYSEFELRKDLFPNMIIEKSKMLYSPLPTYFFVTPYFRKINERIEYGLWKAYEDGSFEELFNRYHSDFIKKADMKNKKIFNLLNPLLPYHESFKDERLWLK